MSDASPTAESEPGPRSEGARAWPHIRAVLVGAHVIAVLCLALPDPGGVGMRRSAWKNPTVQGEFKGWAESLSAFGVETTGPALEERIWGVATAYTKWLAKVKGPFIPYAKHLGIRQTWRMFVAPHRYPGRLHVDVYENERWRPVQIARDPEFDWMGTQINHDRARAMMFRYTWKSYYRHYRALSVWLAKKAAVDFPEATRLRVRIWGFRTASPEEVREDRIPEGEYRQEIVHALERYRR